MKNHPSQTWKGASAAGLLGLLSAVTASHAQQVIITEVMYNPAPGKAEFVEVQNNQATPWDIALWKLEGGVEYRFPDFDPAKADESYLKAFERIVIASVAPGELRKQYPNIPAATRVFGPWQGLVVNGLRTDGFLSNAGEDLTLRDKNGSILCTLSFGDDHPWPVAADGAGHSIHLLNPARRIEDWRNWTGSVLAGGSPGDVEPADTKPKVSLSEVQFGADAKVAWVEVYNGGTTAADLSKLAVATKFDLSDRKALSGSLAPGAYASADMGLSIDTDKVILVDASGNTLSAYDNDRAASNANYQAFPAGSGEWFASTLASRNAVNNPARNQDIVINEIMYAPPVGRNGEYLELYNRGSQTVDVGGWRVELAVDYVIPTGTRIAPDQYLVIGADADNLKATYKGLANVIGNFGGGLSNDGETIRLMDERGNLVDRVDYSVGGEWPWKSDDFGSSIELVNPAMDNNRSSAWADSDETAKATMREYSIKKEFIGTGLFKYRAADQELHFHLVGEGYMILEGIQFIRSADSVNIIKNGDLYSTTGKSANGWLTQGTHHFSRYKDGQLHIISEGRGDNRANRIEIDTEIIARGPVEMELKFKAKWVHGKPRLIVQTVDHGWSHDFLLDVPANVGSPGAKNSRYQANAPVQLDSLLHSPAVPKTTDTVLITARVASVGEIDKVQVAYAKDSTAVKIEDTAAAPWARQLMNDNGTAGDAVAGDGLYSGLLTDGVVKTTGAVAFFVEAFTKTGQRSTVVRDPSRPAFYAVDDKVVNKKLRTMRFALSDYDVKSMGVAGNTAKYEFKHPAVSNWYRNATLIFNESDVIYGCSLRSAGSPWHTGDRANLQLKAKYKMPKSAAYRGRVKGSYDQDAGDVNRRHNDRLARYWLYLFGNPVADNEFFWVALNGGALALREEVEWPGDNWFMDRHWANGSNGQMFRVDDEWDFTDTWAQTQRDADWNYKPGTGSGGSGTSGSSERPGRYHSEYMLRSRETEYDYSSIIGLFRTLTATDYTEEEAARVVDFEQNAMNFAVRGWIHDWDSPSLDRGKNAFIYRRPSDGRFFYVHWDSDLAYDSPTTFLTGKGSTFTRFVKKPYFQRIYFHYLNEVMVTYGQNSPRLAAWFAAETAAAAPDATVNVAKYNTWNKNREKTAIAHMKLGRDALFAVTTNAGNDLSTTDDSFVLEGTAPVDSLEIFVEGHPEAQITWPGLTTWRLSNIVLQQGENVLTVRGRNWKGDLVAGSETAIRSDSIKITKSTPSKPLPVLEANPASLNIALGEELELDAANSFDPEGDALTYAWQGPASIGYGLTADGARMKAAFDRPGLYQFTVTVADGKGGTAKAIREASVYGPGGFSSFTNQKLESYWTGENAPPLASVFQGSYYHLDDKPGHLMIQVIGDTEKTIRSGTFPYLHRALPVDTDWSLQTRYLIATRQFAAFQGGLMVELENGGQPARFAIGVRNGKEIAAWQIFPDASPRDLGALPYLDEGGGLRVRRAGSQLHFEFEAQNAWQTIYSLNLEPGAKGKQGGVFLATDEALNVRLGFDYVSLISPGTATSLQTDLRLTEIMYNPEGGSQYEYLELYNSGAQTLNLKDAEFTQGITYKFGDVALGSGQYLVLAKDRTAFVARYGAAIPLAAGGFDGQLANDGETITLLDGAKQLIFSVTYNDRDAWPAKADGEGSSLEIKDAASTLNSASNWQASAKTNGSPGKAAEPAVVDAGDKDNDGMADAWETQYGLNPANAADAVGDRDADGWNNRGEYIGGTIPTDPKSYLRLQIARNAAGKIALNFPAVKGRDYTVEASNGLRPNEWAKLSDHKATADNPSVAVEDATSKARFYRLKVTISQ